MNIANAAKIATTGNRRMIAEAAPFVAAGLAFSAVPAELAYDVANHHAPLSTTGSQVAVGGSLLATALALGIGIRGRGGRLTMKIIAPAVLGTLFIGASGGVALADPGEKPKVVDGVAGSPDGSTDGHGTDKGGAASQLAPGSGVARTTPAPTEGATPPSGQPGDPKPTDPGAGTGAPQPGDSQPTDPATQPPQPAVPKPTNPAAVDPPADPKPGDTAPPANPTDPKPGDTAPPANPTDPKAGDTAPPAQPAAPGTSPSAPPTTEPPGSPASPASPASPEAPGGSGGVTAPPAAKAPTVPGTRGATPPAAGSGSGHAHGNGDSHRQAHPPRPTVPAAPPAKHEDTHTGIVGRVLGIKPDPNATRDVHPGVFAPLNQAAHDLVDAQTRVSTDPVVVDPTVLVNDQPDSVFGAAFSKISSLFGFGG